MDNLLRRSIAVKILLGVSVSFACSLPPVFADAPPLDITKTDTNTNAHSYGYQITDDNTSTIVKNISETVNNRGWSGVGGNASATAYGVYNSGYTGTLLTAMDPQLTITATATGGSASTRADAKAYGIVGNSNSISGNATITTTATGGSASSTSANAIEYSYGIFGNSNSISGNVTINATATGGNAGDTHAYAYGIGGDSNSICGNAMINATAIGGSGSTSADADAYGIGGVSNSISGNATINAMAIGGSGSTIAIATAYGIRGNGNSIIGNATINATAIGGSGSNAYAYGISQDGRGTSSIGGNAIITATATATAPHGTAYAYSLYSYNYYGGGTININQAVGNPYTVQLTGDVFAANGGTINLNLNNSASFLQGNVIADGGTVNLTLGNQAVWEPVYDNRNGTISYAAANGLSSSYSNYVNSITALTLTGGIVDLIWDGSRNTYRTLNIGTLKGGSGTFKIKTDLANHTGDTIVIGTVTSPTTLGVAVTDPVHPGVIAVSGNEMVTMQPFSTSYTPLTVTSGASNVTLVGAASDSGAYSIVPIFTGSSITGLQVGAGTNTKAAAGAAAAQRNFQIPNHLRKRLGDLRSNPDTEEGVWARGFTGDISDTKYNTVESYYKGLQVGYDRSHKIDGGKLFTGIAASYTTANDTFTRGGGESKGGDVALYETWLGKDGHYCDLIAKHGRISNNYHVTDLSNVYSTADYHTVTNGISMEYGYRKNLADGWYLEPQTEVSYNHMSGVNYTTSSGLNISQDGISSLIGRMGIGAGKKLADGTQVYTSLSVLHEFAGEQSVKADMLTYKEDHGGSWYEFIVGLSGKTGEKSQGYMNLEKLFGGKVSSNWQVNAGCRWNF